MHGERDGAKLFFKIAEAYALMDVYHFSLNSILTQSQEYLDKIKTVSICWLYYKMWDENISYEPES